MPPHRKRKLLLIYIHGFMGNETSFQEFPLHVHNAVTAKLRSLASGAEDATNYAVQSKIYPKYKTRRKVEDVVNDVFSPWLLPHEGPHTDIILLGHSMGGILSAETVLLKSKPRPESLQANDDPVESFKSSGNVQLRHRILGTINFDVPFLGMHPQVIKSGLGSLFRSPESETPPPGAPEAEGAASSRGDANVSTSSLESASYFPPTYTSHTDGPSFEVPATSAPGPTSYDPPFYNDVRLPQRSAWQNALHFLDKHSDGLRVATKAYLSSHVEFGGCLTDYQGLRDRYVGIRRLADGQGGSRVRFVNYYTAAIPSRKIKRIASQVSESGVDAEQKHDAKKSQQLIDEESIRTKSLSPSIPSIKVDSLGRNSSIEDAESLPGSSVTLEDTSTCETAAMSDNDAEVRNKPLVGVVSSSSTDTDASKSPLNSLSAALASLPPLPNMPTEPAPFRCDSTDKEVRKIAENGHKRQTKAFERAKRDHEHAVADRAKYIKKKEKEFAKEQAKLEKARGSKKQNNDLSEHHDEKNNSHIEEQADEEVQRRNARKQAEKDLKRARKEEAKAAREGHFCVLPSGNMYGVTHSQQLIATSPQQDYPYPAASDPCWIKVPMHGVDEVGAHCGLFLPDRASPNKSLEEIKSSDKAEDAPVDSGATPSPFYDARGLNSINAVGTRSRYDWFVEDVSARIVQWTL